MPYKYELLHYLRKNRRVSLALLAEELQISRSYLSLIECGKRSLSYDLAIKIATYFGMKPDDLFYQDHLYADNNEVTTFTKAL
jgi:putative transcriptional regulator